MQEQLKIKNPNSSAISIGTVTDNAGATVEQKYSLKVVADEIAPSVNVKPSVTPAGLFQPLTYYVNATDNIGIKTLTLTIRPKTRVLVMRRKLKQHHFCQPR